MKYNIFGFSQEQLVEFDLDIKDAAILRWYVDFLPKMVTVINNNKVYNWINYKSIINDLPCLKIDNKRCIARRIDKLVEVGIMEKWIYKKSGENGGTYSCFRLTEKYLLLVGLHQSMQSIELDDNLGGVDLNVQGGVDLKVQPKDPSIKINPSTKPTNQRETFIDKNWNKNEEKLVGKVGGLAGENLVSKVVNQKSEQFTIIRDYENTEYCDDVYYPNKSPKPIHYYTNSRDDSNTNDFGQKEVEDMLIKYGFEQYKIVDKILKLNVNLEQIGRNLIYCHSKKESIKGAGYILKAIKSDYNANHSKTTPQSISTTGNRHKIELDANKRALKQKLLRNNVSNQTADNIFGKFNSYEYLKANIDYFVTTVNSGIRIKTSIDQLATSLIEHNKADYLEPSEEEKKELVAKNKYMQASLNFSTLSLNELKKWYTQANDCNFDIKELMLLRSDHNDYRTRKTFTLYFKSCA